MNPKKILAKNIQKHLDRRGITQTKMAHDLGYPEMTVSNWMKEKTYPRVDRLQQMADYFNIRRSDLTELKEEDTDYKVNTSNYTYFPTAISAGLPLEIDGITESSKITVSDEFLGKWANNKNIFFAHINGDSMNRLMQCGSLIAVKPINSIDELKNGDIVVYSVDGEYSVKHYYKYGDTLVFKPNSTTEHEEHTYNVNDN